MDEELYEDLPGGDLIQEDLYDSIETYQQERLPSPPKQAAPPPLPSVSTIPSSGPQLPARNDPPSLPPRNQLTNSTTMPGGRMPPPTLAAPPPPTGHPHPPVGPPGVSPTSPVSSAPHAHGTISSISAKDVSRLKPVKNVKPPPKRETSSGGLDMKTIQQEALKKRGHIDLEALEKRNKKEDNNSDTQAPPPWAGQLKKRKPADNISNASLEDKEEENLAPWVRSKRGSFSEDAPPWVRKRLDSKSETPPPIAKKPIKEKISEEPTLNGNIDSMHFQKPVPPKPSPKPPPSPKPLNDSSAPNVRLKPAVAPKSVSPKPSPTIPPRFDSSEPHVQEAEKTSPPAFLKTAVPKKVPPPKPPRADIPPSPTIETRSLQNEASSAAELGPPSFTPELPPTSSTKEKMKPPTIPKRMPPPSIPAPPPPSDAHDEVGPPPFSPPKYPAPPPPMNQAPPLPPLNSAMNQAPPLPPPNPAPPPPTNMISPPVTNPSPPLPGRQIPVSPPQVAQVKRYRRRSIPSHNAYSAPAVPDRITKPSRRATTKPAQVSPAVVRPQIKPPIASSVNTTAPDLPQRPAPTSPSLQQKAPPPPPPAAPDPEEFECDDFYDDVDTVKKAMPSANAKNPINIAGVTTTESNVDEEEGELYDDVAGATTGMQHPPPAKAAPPPPPPELQQDDNYDLHPEEPIAEENYDLHPSTDDFEEDQTYEMPPPEPPEQAAAGNGDIPVEESFYETVTSDSSKTLPQKQGAALNAASSNTMPSPNMSKKLSKAELKEQKKREKELEKERILQEKEREKNEKERKRLEELRQKNRKKYFVKNFKQFGFNPDSVPCIFATEAINANSKGKDHLILQGGEHIIVLLTSHDKLPEGKYLCEKTDGTVGYVDYRNLRDNVEGDCGQEAHNRKSSFPPPSMPAPPPPS